MRSLGMHRIIALTHIPSAEVPKNAWVHFVIIIAKEITTISQKLIPVRIILIQQNLAGVQQGFANRKNLVSSQTTPIRLLIAEDEEGLRSSLLEYFTALDYEVTAVDDGVKALELFQKNTFDVILTDIRMPNKTGIDLLVRVQKSKAKTGKGPKVIIMTGLLEAGEDYLKSLGATEVIEKPIRLDELAKIIENAVAQKT